MRLLPLTLPLILACSGLFQSNYAGFTALCDAQSTCTECGEAPADARLKVLANHVDGLLGSNDARMAFQAIAYASPETKGKLLRHAAAEAGVETCALADFFDQSAKNHAASTLCSLPTCKTFDPEDLATLAGCLDEEDGMVRDELARMPKDKAALARAVEAYARSNGNDRCELVLELRKPSP